MRTSQLFPLCICGLLAVIPMGCKGPSVNPDYEGGYEPPEGFVPDKETAMRIAEAVWIPIYGADEIQKQKPFTVWLEKGVWCVEGFFPDDGKSVGGAAIIRIRKKDGAILYVTHTL